MHVVQEDAKAAVTASPEGRRSLLESLFDAHHDRVYRFVYARSGSAQMAEDVASDTFADAARLCASGRGGEVSEAWLLTVARHRLVDQWRRADRHRKRIQRVAALPRHPSPEVGVDRDEDVIAALDSLADRQRLALTMRYLDELSVAEIADVMGQSYRATESLLARARRSFRVAYEEGSA